MRRRLRSTSPATSCLRPSCCPRRLRETSTTLLGALSSAGAGWLVGRSLGTRLLRRLASRRVARLARSFSRRGLFAVLEDSLPDGVRLVNVAPNLQKGQITLRLTAVARTVDEALEFMRALEERPEFANVWPTSRGSGQEGFDYQYEMTYLPQPRKVAASPAPSPAPASSVEVPAAAVASATAARGAR